MKNKFYVLSFIIVVAISCRKRPDDTDLITSNKSEHTIYSIISPDDIMNGATYYAEFRDTSENQIIDERNKFVFVEIQPNTKYANHDRPLNWEGFFKLSSKDHQLRLFIVKKDSVEKYGWPQIFKRQIYNKKFKLTREDLNKCNWEIIYK